MIKNYYPSKSKIQFVKQHYAFVSTDGIIPTEREISRALILNISVQEYRIRCEAVKDALKDCHLQVGDTGFSALPKDNAKYGKLIIVGICRSYDTYGSVEWHNPPYLLCVSPLKDRTIIVNCTINWFTKKEEDANVC